MDQGSFPGGSPEYAPATPGADAGYEPHLVSPEPGSESPSPSQAPGQPYAPTGAEAPPEVDPRITTAEQRAQQAEAEAQQFRAAFGELQQMAARAQLEAQRQAVRDESSRRLEQAYTVAADMDPESALTYLRRNTEAELANLHRQIGETEAQAQARLEQTVAQIAVPQYAQARGRELGFSDEEIQLLSGVPAHLIDAVFPFVQTFAQQRKQWQSQFEQLGRSTRAGEMAGSGAFNPGGNGASPSPPGAAQFDPNSPDYNSRAFLTNILERSGIVKTRR